MSLPPDRIEPRSLVPAGENNLPSQEKRTFKDQVKVMTMWLGRRFSNNSDYHAFNSALMDYARFPLQANFAIPEAAVVKEPYPELASVVRDLNQHLKKSVGPLAVFLITTPQIAEYPWVDSLSHGIEKVYGAYSQEEAFVYKIIMDGGGYFSKKLPLNEEDSCWEGEKIARELNALYLHFSPDAPSNGCHRLVELINRILGKDLPGPYFPDYNQTDLQKMAWYINRQSFNCPPGEGIQKYEIGEDGKPIFLLID